MQRASASYKQKRDNPSLQVLSDHLRVGMPRTQVLEWLGPPDYSPTAGQDNYSASDSKRNLVIDYREGDRPTERVTKVESINVGD